MLGILLAAIAVVLPARASADLVVPHPGTHPVTVPVEPPPAAPNPAPAPTPAPSPAPAPPSNQSPLPAPSSDGNGKGGESGSFDDGPGPTCFEALGCFFEVMGFDAPLDTYDPINPVKRDWNIVSAKSTDHSDLATALLFLFDAPVGMVSVFVNSAPPADPGAPADPGVWGGPRLSDSDPCLPTWQSMNYFVEDGHTGLESC